MKWFSHLTSLFNSKELISVGQKSVYTTICTVTILWITNYGINLDVLNRWVAKWHEVNMCTAKFYLGTKRACWYLYKTKRTEGHYTNARHRNINSIDWPEINGDELVITRSQGGGKRYVEFYHFALYLSVEYHSECHSRKINMSIGNENEKIIILMVIWT